MQHKRSKLPPADLALFYTSCRRSVIDCVIQRRSTVSHDRARVYREKGHYRQEYSKAFGFHTKALKN